MSKMSDTKENILDFNLDISKLMKSTLGPKGPNGCVGITGPVGIPGTPGIITTDEELAERKKYQQAPNTKYSGDRVVIIDDEYPEDEYSIRIVGGKIITLPNNKSAHRRVKLNNIIDGEG